MQTIKAIETVYKGYRFRSRLEARWAVFFDALGLKYKYEPEGFMNEFGAYLPDFELLDMNGRTINLYAEVKGDPFALVDNFDEFVALHDFDGVLPNFANSLGSYRGLLLLGDIPLCKKDHIIFFPLIQHCEGLWRSWVMFSGIDYPILSGFAHGTEENIDGNSDGVRVIHQERCCSEIIRMNHWHRSMPLVKHFPIVNAAFISARSARFEHGENGTKP